MYKTLARTLRDDLAQQGHPVSLALSLELTAALCGIKDWNTLKTSQATPMPLNAATDALTTRRPPFLPGVLSRGGLFPGHTEPTVTAGGLSTAPGLGVDAWPEPNPRFALQNRYRTLRKGTWVLGEKLPAGLAIYESSVHWTDHAFHPAFGSLDVTSPAARHQRPGSILRLPMHHAGPEGLLRLSRAFAAGYTPPPITFASPPASAWHLHRTVPVNLGGMIADIDVEMEGVVRALNERGFPTGFCCQGEAHGGLYFVLRPGVNLPPDLLSAAQGAGFSLGGPGKRVLPLPERTTWRFGLWDSAPPHLIKSTHRGLRRLLDDWVVGNVDRSGDRYRTEPTLPPLPDWWDAGR